MPEVEYGDQGRLTEDLRRLLQTFPAARRELVEDVGQEMLSTVQKTVGGAGEVQSWQALSIGSKGGYAAVRPRRKEEYKGYAVGHITNAIDGGHKVRGPSGKAKRYRPRIHKTRVAGKGFYREAGRQMDGIVNRAAKELLDRVAKEMEG